MSELGPFLPKVWGDRCAALEGLISPAVGDMLACLAAGVRRDRVIVELGSYRGKSTAYLAAGAAVGNGARIVAVDPWDTPGNATGRFGFADPQTRQRFLDQLESVGLLERVLPLRGFSTDVARHWMSPIGLLYVDGSHTEKDVAADVAAWATFIRSGGIIAFDDYRTFRNPGVEKVVDRLRKSADWLDWCDEVPPLIWGKRK